MHADVFVQTATHHDHTIAFVAMFMIVAAETEIDESQGMASEAESDQACFPLEGPEWNIRFGEWCRGLQHGAEGSGTHWGRAEEEACPPQRQLGKGKSLCLRTPIHPHFDVTGLDQQAYLPSFDLLAYAVTARGNQTMHEVG